MGLEDGNDDEGSWVPVTVPGRPPAVESPVGDYHLGRKEVAPGRHDRRPARAQRRHWGHHSWDWRCGWAPRLERLVEVVEVSPVVRNRSWG